MKAERTAIRARSTSAFVGPFSMKRRSSSSIAASTFRSSTPAFTSDVIPKKPAISSALWPADALSAI